MNALEMLSLPVALDETRMLFWRLDLVKQSFVTLNTCPAGVIGRESFRFFKDSDFRNKMLFPDDRVRVEDAFTRFRRNTAATLIFRVQCEGNIHWYKLKGWPTEDGRYYDGSVEDISEYVAYLQNIFDQQSSRLIDIDSAPYPVALFREDGRMERFKANCSFADLFAGGSLPDLLGSDAQFAQRLEQLLAERSVQGDFLLDLGDGNLVKTLCRMESFHFEGQGFIRLALLSRLETTPKRSSGTQDRQRLKTLKQLCRDIGDCDSLDGMLDRIYDEKNLFPGMDVIMFSDIYARKNRVIVYSKGEMSEPFEQGTKYPYAGTIAENIEKEKLEYLIVDDTQSSIKAIDWMLFVPKGLYSYIAKALYVRGAMRTVLILCSKSKNTFSEEQAADVEMIAKAFHQRLKQLRRKK